MKSQTYTLAALALGLLSPLPASAQSDGTSHGNGHDDRMAREQMLHTPCTRKVPAGSTAYISISGGSGNSTKSGGTVQCNPKLTPVSRTDATTYTRSSTITFGGMSADGKKEMNRINRMGDTGSDHYGN